MTKVKSPEMSPSLSGNMFMTEVTLQIPGAGTITAPHRKNKTN